MFFYQLYFIYKYFSLLYIVFTNLKSLFQNFSIVLPHALISCDVISASAGTITYLSMSFNTMTFTSLLLRFLIFFFRVTRYMI